MKLTLTRRAGIPVVLLATLVLTVPSFVGPRPMTTVDGLLSQLIPVAPPPGEKDTFDNLDEFRIGWALWDVGEERGGYGNAIAGLNDIVLAGNQALSAYDALLVDPLNPLSTPWDEIDDLYQAFFLEDWSKFSLTVDFPRAFDQLPNVNSFTFQSALCTPVPPVLGVPGPPFDHYVFYDFPYFTNAFFPAVQALPAVQDVKLVQNIGFVNAPNNVANDYDFNVQFPMVSKYLVPGGGGFFPPLLVNPSPSLTPNVTVGTVTIRLRMTHPTVAQLVVDSLVDRVTAFPDAFVDYNLISGEHSLDGPPNTFFNSLPTANPVDCTGISDGAAFFECLPLADYSDETLEQFRKWLSRQARYPDLATLMAAWGVAEFPCPQVGFPCDPGAVVSCCDPLTVAIEDCASITAALELWPYCGTVGDYDAVLADWIEFQAEQTHIDSLAFQYGAAKEANPDQLMYDLRGYSLGQELGALYSDGVAVGDWYQFLGPDPSTIYGRQQTTDVKQSAVHGVTYGESVNFSIFGMPRLNPLVVHDTTAGPSTFDSPGWDIPFCYRTLREMVALGVDSIGVGYYEVSTNWNIIDGVFDAASFPGQTMMEVMSNEIEGLRSPRAFTSPWRSPLLVHTGLELSTPNGKVDQYNDGSLNARTFEFMSERQWQFAPFSLVEGLDDLWLPSQREFLFSTFVPDLDKAMVDKYIAVADEHEMDLLVLIDFDKLNEQLALDPADQIAIGAFFGTQELFGFQLVGGTNPPGLRREIWVLGLPDGPTHGATLDLFVEAILDLQIEPDIGAADLRPIEARSGGALRDDIDLTVASDGLGFLVTAANASDVSQTIDLDVALPAVSPVTGWEFVGGSQIQIDEGDAAIRYVRPLIDDVGCTDPGCLSAADWDAAVTAAVDHVNDPDPQAPLFGFDKRAALELLAELQEIDAGLYPEKILAGLMRLRKMTFLKLETTPGSPQITAVEYDGSPIVGASVQVEFVLQQRYRNKAQPDTDSMGVSLLDLRKPRQQVYDFIAKEYTFPTTRLVEVQVQHPTWGTQSATAVVPYLGP